MNVTEALFVLWFVVSVGCVLLAWVKSHWITAVVVAVVALVVGYLIGVIE